MKMGDWIMAAPRELVALMGRLTMHTRVDWQKAAYELERDKRVVTTVWNEAEVFSSFVNEEMTLVEVTPAEEGELLGETEERPVRFHQLVVDVDPPAWLVPSSREGHHHLYVNLPNDVPQELYFDWLKASAAIGLLEEGYVHACIARGMTSVRVPWKKKEGYEDGEVRRPDRQ